MTTARLTDVHAHYLTEEYVARARAAGLDRPDGMPTWPSWSLEDQLAAMTRTGIDHAVLSLSSPGVYFGNQEEATNLARHVNDAAADAVARHPDRLSWLASLPLPAVDAAVAELERALGLLGAAGVVLMSNVEGIYLGDQRLDPVYEALDRHRALVLVHPTSPPSWESVSSDRPRPMIEFMFETTRTITDMVFAGVVERFPGMRIVIPHCGAALPLLGARIERFRSALPGPDGASPTDSSTLDQLRRYWFDVAGYPLPHQLPALLRAVGEERVLYGSDSCWTPIEAIERQLASLDSASPPLSAPTWRGLLSANAARVLERF